MAEETERRQRADGWTAGPTAAAPRRWLAERLAAGAPGGVVLVGLSRLDLLNAAHGRAAGDRAVRTAQARLERIAAAAAGVAARLGGGRFALAVPGDRAATLRRASEAAELLAQPDAGGVVIGSRAGVAIADPDETAEAVLARAGEALARAREGEGGAPLLVERGRAASLDEMAVDLHHAVARDEIAILFQPQVTIAGGRIVGAEALARWRHPRHGSLGADALFAAAARADLGLALSEHIQARALAAAAAWPAALRSLRLSVNVTAGDVARAGFADALLARVAASGFAADRLTLELTETGPLADPAGAAAALAALRAAGCRIAIDDFGAGYSSLAQVRALPLDTIKLDKTLVDGIAPGSRGAALVTAAVAMARALGLSTIAEGVESDAQRAVLAAAGCDQYQGFLCAAPLEAVALARLVELGAGGL